MVSINAEHKLSVSISDAAGRGVMSAQIEPYNGTTPNALITWSCQQYDNVVTVSGFGDCLESLGIVTAEDIERILMEAPSAPRLRARREAGAGA